MKKHSILAILIVAFAITIHNGCKKDSDPDDTIYVDLPAEMMTLSAIAYSANQYSNEVIKDSILFHLSDSSLATGGKWELVWGPGISPTNANLSYVVKNNTGDLPQYAVVIRGTVSVSFQDIIEDIDVFNLAQWPYGESGDSVCHGAMVGFNNIINATDPVEGTTLEEYLSSVTTTSKLPIYVTGHSQGGGQCPLMAYWLTTHSDFKNKFLCSTYGFASPGWVNKSFRDNLLNSIPADASYNTYVNNIDLVPYGYGDIGLINERNIPVHVPFPYRLMVAITDSILTHKGIKYYNIVVADSIGEIPVVSPTSGGLTPADTIDWYNHWLLVEHTRNNYLKLLGAKPVN